MALYALITSVLGGGLGQEDRKVPELTHWLQTQQALGSVGDGTSREYKCRAPNVFPWVLGEKPPPKFYSHERRLLFSLIYFPVPCLCSATSAQSAFAALRRSVPSHRAAAHDG